MKYVISLLLMTLLFLGCISQDGVVENGDRVRVDYVISLENSTVVDTTNRTVAEEAGIIVSHGLSPATVIVGDRVFIRGFEDALVGMHLGETKEVIIEPVNGYGVRSANLVMTFPVRQLDPKVKKEVGATVYSGQMKGIITTINETDVTVDFNHPLAGKKLLAKLTVVEIKKG